MYFKSDGKLYILFYRKLKKYTIQLAKTISKYHLHFVLELILYDKTFDAHNT